MGQFQKQYDESRAAVGGGGKNLMQADAAGGKTYTNLENEKVNLFPGGSALQIEAFKAQLAARSSAERSQ